MNKKTVLIVLIAVGAGLITVSLFTSDRSTPTQSPIISTSPAVKPASSVPILSSKTKIYIDPSGFKFTYPDDINVEPKKTTDNSTYSHLILSSKKEKGTIGILIQDTSLKDSSAWVKNLEKASPSPIPIALAELKGFKVTGKKTVDIGLVDQGVLYTITLDSPSSTYWEKALEKVAGTFMFIPQNNTSAPSTESGGDDIFFEGEETIE